MRKVHGATSVSNYECYKEIAVLTTSTSHLLFDNPTLNRLFFAKLIIHFQNNFHFDLIILLLFVFSDTASSIYMGIGGSVRLIIEK